ncbi:MAG: polysaccharide biosynthesis tyrosine autokinase [Verrucomicrobia bacterium]|nr:polysaccharide biosynthesis tyrosine autokinase [Verrucomicrobiota bacterium]
MFHDQQDLRDQPPMRQVFGVLLTRRWLILGVLVVTVGATAFYTLSQPEVYRATARIMIEPRSPVVIEAQKSSRPGDADRDYYETQYRLLKDRELAKQVFFDLEAATRPEYAGVEDPVAAFMSGLYVAPLKKSRLVDVGYEHTDPVWATRVANTMVTTYIEQTQHRDFSASERMLIELTRQAQELEAKLQASHAALQQFTEETDLVAVDREDGPASTALTRLAYLEEAVTQAQIKRIALAAGYETTKRLQTTNNGAQGVAALFQSDGLRTLRIALAEAQQKRAELVQNYLPNHPAVQAVDSQIVALRESIAEEGERVLTTMGAEYERAKAEEQSLQEAYKTQRREVQAIGRFATRYAVLKMEAERSSRLYDVVLDRIKEINLVSEVERGGTNVVSIHEAIVPRHPVRPNKRGNLALACLGGLVLGAGLALSISRFDTSFKSKEDIESALNAPILGFVPAVRPRKRRGERCPEHVGLHDPRSAVAETFRAISVGMLRRSGGGLARRLVITSAVPKEGKSLIAINLAAALARSGERVLLVDADLRRAGLVKVFNLRIWATLSSYLRPDVEDVTFNEIVYSTGVPNLDILPCARPTANPVELLESPKMTRLIREAMNHYDRIVFDAPPCLGLADASVLAANADATLLVVRAFVTPRHLTERAREVIDSVAHNIIGVIVNDVDAERYGGYYGYGRYYGRADHYGRTEADTEDPGVGPPSERELKRLAARSKTTLSCESRPSLVQRHPGQERSTHTIPPHAAGKRTGNKTAGVGTSNTRGARPTPRAVVAERK